MRPMLWVCLLGASLGFGSAAAVEHTTYEPLAYVPATATNPHCVAVALMNVPPGWQPGDAAVLLLARASLRDIRRDRLVAALLQAQAAVVEAVTHGGTNCRATAAEEPVAAHASTHVIVFAVLEAARRAGAGLIVAVGFGIDGDSVLDAVREGVAIQHLAADGPRLAAAVSVEGDVAGFALGAPMGPTEAAPWRLLRFCDALAEGLADLDEAAGVATGRMAASCRRSLAPGIAPPEARIGAITAEFGR